MIAEETLARAMTADTYSLDQDAPAEILRTDSMPPVNTWPAMLPQSSRARGRCASNEQRTFDPRAFVPKRTDTEISRRYTINRHELGSGNYGKVFVADDREIEGRRVAIKKLSLRDAEAKETFQKEVAIMKELDHPNICKIFETYSQGHIVYIVMEYCEGGEVFDRIAELGLIDERTTADIVRQVARALKYAHGRGIAHRDLKPENTCFCSDDVSNTEVKVIDWGVGFYFGHNGMRTPVGSMSYAAPEVLQATGRSGYTAACDLWSLGVLSYVMLCGKPPFWGSHMEQLRKMKAESYPMSDATWKATSGPAKDLVRGLLKRDPMQRLSVDNVLDHPWLRCTASFSEMERSVMHEVLYNMRQFHRTSHFFSICAASLAKQLDHRSLRDMHSVFCEMDTNGDGVLELSEVRSGFARILGEGSEQLRDIEELFARLDLDGSGAIDYTEFCAAGIGQRMTMEEDVAWAAFKAFDIHDDDGRITKDEIKEVLANVDVDKVWSKEVCEEVAEELFARFDRDGDGSLDFQEWLQVMRSCAEGGEDCGESRPLLLTELGALPTRAQSTVTSIPEGSVVHEDVIEACYPRLLGRRSQEHPQEAEDRVVKRRAPGPRTARDAGNLLLACIRVLGLLVCGVCVYSFAQ